MEAEPLLIIDNLLEDPASLIDYAVRLMKFEPVQGFYPGTRMPSPDIFKALFHEQLKELISTTFQLETRQFAKVDSDFSIVSRPCNQLTPLQRIPHFDGTNRTELASLFYLCGKTKGGTSFYRHRSTGYEYVDEKRKEKYAKQLDSDVKKHPLEEPPRYINGTTKLFERILSCDASINRLLIYRSTSLHSGNINPSYDFDTKPQSGRLTVASFLHE